MRLALRALALLIAGCLAAFVAGFFVYLSSVNQYGEMRGGENADGIVVLTGGQGRIEAGLALLVSDKGGRLLISGVHPSTSRDVLRKTFSTDDARFRCCVDVDRYALDTAGNATETARWVADHGFGSVIVVTNDYHMPRSMLEMRRQMGAVELIAHPVVATSRNPDDPVVFADRYRVLFGEYLKYAVARIRPWLGMTGISKSNRVTL